MRWKAKTGVWRKWFAWRPVLTAQGYYVWLEYVERIHNANERCYFYRNLAEAK